MIKKCDAKIGNRRCKLLSVTPKAEHGCLVAYSTAELFSLHALMWYVTAGLVLFGVLSFVWGYLAGTIEE